MIRSQRAQPPQPYGAVRRVCWPVFLCVLSTAAWAGAPPASPGSASSSAATEEITISAQSYDRRILEREILPQFVQTHAAPTPLNGQMTRWHDPVCPDVAGAPPEYAAAVTGRIFAAAQAAGAPHEGAAHRCSPNIRIFFTTAPQQLVDRIDKERAFLLGSGRVKGDTTVSRAIQAWYLTGTRQVSSSFPAQGLNAPGLQGPMPMGAAGMARGPGMNMGMGMNGMNNGGAMPPVAPPPTSNMPLPVPSIRVVPDPAWDKAAAPGGVAGSRMGLPLRSELLHVMIVVDGQKLNGMSLQAVSDYIALLALTRVAALDACNVLPSIMDLLAAQCGDRDKPAALSSADAAFLKALYTSSLEGKIGIEEAEVSAKMLAALKQPPN